MKLSGISGIIEFLNELEKRKIIYKISKMRDDSVMINLTIVGHRIEIDFFDDHIEYSVFSGNEEVLSDQNELWKLIYSHK